MTKKIKKQESMCEYDNNKSKYRNKRFRRRSWNDQQEDRSLASQSGANKTFHNANIRQIPGYYYDEESKRYFKIDRQLQSFCQIVQRNADKRQDQLHKTEVSALENSSIPLFTLNRRLNFCRTNTFDRMIYCRQLSDTALGYRIQQIKQCFELSNPLETSARNICFLKENVFLASESNAPKVYFMEKNEIYGGLFLERYQVNSSDIVKIMFSSKFNVAVFCYSGGVGIPGQLRMAKFKLDSTPVEATNPQNLILSNNLTFWTIQWYQRNFNYYYDNMKQDSYSSILSIGTSKGALLVDLTSYKIKCKIHTQNSDVFSQVFTDENLIWNGCRDGYVRLFDQRDSNSSCRSNTVQKIFCSSSVASMEYIPCTNMIFTCTVQGAIYAWDKRNCAKPVLEFRKSDPNLIQNITPFYLIPSYHPHDHMLMYSDKSGNMYIWNTLNAELLFHRKHPSPLVSCCCLNNGYSYFSFADNKIFTVGTENNNQIEF